MATPPFRPLEPAGDRTDPVFRLVDLYRRELETYRRVLDLSRRQGELIRRDAGFADLRTVLEEKKRCLAVIARLEREETAARTAWDRDRDDLSTEDRGRVHRALQSVADLIEEILAEEERNDDEILRRTGIL